MAHEKGKQNLRREFGRVIDTCDMKVESRILGVGENKRGAGRL